MGDYIRGKGNNTISRSSSNGVREDELPRYERRKGDKGVSVEETTPHTHER